MKKEKIFNIITIILLSLLLSLSMCWRSTDTFGWLQFLIIAAIIAFIFYFVWPRLTNLKKLKLTKIKKWEFIVYAIVIIIPLIIGILAYYPALASSDTGSQWLQVQKGVYNNWHPVMHTLFMMKLPSLFYNNIISSTIFQCLIIMGMLIYFCYVCRKKFLNFPQTLLTLIIIVANPLFISYSVTIWKDITYSWFMFLATLFLINIATTDGEWLKKHWHKVVFALAILGVMFFRHNGIVPVFVMLIYLIIFYPKIRKISIITSICVFATYFLTTGPIYKAFNIPNQAGNKGELMGEMMGQISYYYNNGAYFTDKELKLLSKIAPLEAWKNYYMPRNFNNLKWNATNYGEPIEEQFGDYLKLYFSKSLQNPAMFIKSFLNMTSPIWETNNYIYGAHYNKKVPEFWLTDKGNFKETSDKIFFALVDYNGYVSFSPFRYIFVSIGQGMWLMLLGIAIIIKKHKDFFKKLLPYTLVLINSLVIMLLITGEEIRFVYSQAICVIPLLIYSLFYENKNKFLKEVKKK